jgi:U4/U6 small nuclear ribonucleoprotein PRP4
MPSKVEVKLTQLIGHGDRVGGVAWHPRATLDLSPESANLVSGAADCSVNLWSLERYPPYLHHIQF